MPHASVVTELTARDADLQAKLAKGEGVIRSFGVSVGGLIGKAALGFGAMGAARRTKSGSSSMFSRVSTMERPISGWALPRSFFRCARRFSIATVRAKAPFSTRRS